MIKAARILFIFTSLLQCGLAFAFSNPTFHTNNPTLVVSVYAGEDRVMCNSDTLYLDVLDAEISGMATNGYWFTDGDGEFLPCEDSNCRFSEATFYVPGPQDISNGNFKLLLVSDDPDGIGPMPQVVDEVQITLLGNIAIVCNGFLNISLNNNCEQLITANMLVTNLQQPVSFYTVSLKDNTNKIIPNNTIKATEINENVTFTVGHECGENTCWGTIFVQDKLAPPITCKNKTINCGTSTLADSIGLPIPNGAIATKINAYSYAVTNFDACSVSTLNYSDTYTEYLCDTLYQSQIKRSWTATDGSGNKSSCSQFIKIKNKTFAQVTFPPNYDGVSKPSLQCGGIWPVDANGNPSPDTTGYPNVIGCTNMGAFYTDTRFELCGEGYKLLRVWEVINWCSSESFTQNQLIKIEDNVAPIFDCPGDITVGSSPYVCGSLLLSLPIPTSIEDCSATITVVEIYENTTLQDFSHLVINNVNGTHSVNNLPIGYYTVNYIVLDECSNKDTCIYGVTVIDDIPPIPVCDQFTKVSLGSTGSGRLLATTPDDGSTDNCTPVNFKIARNATNPVFGDFIDYTCIDLDVSQMVVLRVTDGFGNSNTCMVQVDLQDKLPPIIHCPDDLTISCKLPLDLNDLNAFGKVVVLPNPTNAIIINDEYNNGIAGYDGYAQDNCKPTITTSYIADIVCNQGLLTRIFTATDQRGNVASCSQYIDILNPDVFDRNDIVFPANIEIVGCDTSQAKPAVTGFPDFSNTGCASVAATYEDAPFYFTDNACIKILRTWTVIDWCQFNQDPNTGIWTALQTIKLNNSVDPVINAICKDTTVCLFAGDCGVQRYELLIAASDDCTAPNDLNYSWNIDFNNDGNINASGTSAVVNKDLPIGKHRFSFAVTDDCNNSSTCNYFITVKDCKKPTSYCNTSITTAIMPSSANLTITAQSFDLASFDNCTSDDSLLFSFSSNVNQKQKTITCSDILDGQSQTLELQIWVTDKAGNQEYCQTEITISDNSNVCPDNFQTGEILGNISSFDDLKKIENVAVQLKNKSQTISKQNTTDASGYYAFEAVPTQESYSIKPHLNEDIYDGLNTLDIIKIQRHILGNERFNSPFQIIASDMDGNKKVSVSDLVVLRKIVLKLINELPKKKNCWTFIDKKYTFLDPNIPFNYPDSIVINSFNGNFSEGNDFYAVKYGDVNNSFLNFQSTVTSENRNRKNVGLQIITENDQTKFILNQELMMSGFEISIKGQGIDSISNEVTSKLNENFYFNFLENELKLIWHPSTSTWLPNNEVLFEIGKLPGKVNVNGVLFSDGLQELTIHILEKTEKEEDEVVITTINDKLQLSLLNDENLNVDLMIFDVLGRVVKMVHSIEINATNPFILNVDSSLKNTPLVVQLRFKNRIFTRKLIF